MPISPRTLQGFRDFLPEAMIPRERLMETARQVYRSYGFNPIDTPTLELLEILLGKGSEETDRQLYHFQDNGGRKVGMRFDLTVPLARFAAQHIGQIGTPFKRYHIAPVWRGERPQKGRYREFMQCDFDTIGTQSVSADIETILVMHDLMRAVGIQAFTIRMNHRAVLNGLLEGLGLLERSTEILRALDKLGKAGPARVVEELQAKAGASEDQANRVLAFSQIGGTNDSVLTQLETMVGTSATGQEGIGRLRDVIDGTRSAGMDPACLDLDVSIARGLDYYTGLIVETFLDELPAIGSVCSGGRYDHLAEVYTRQELPGIGASLGLDRLLAAMQELGLVPSVRTAAEVFLPWFDSGRLHDYLRLGSQLRAAGCRVELYPEPKKLGQQLKYAGARGFQVAVIAGEEEVEAQVVQVKDLDERTSQEVSISQGVDELVIAINQILARNNL